MLSETTICYSSLILAFLCICDRLQGLREKEDAFVLSNRSLCDPKLCNHIPLWVLPWLYMLLLLQRIFKVYADESQGLYFVCRKCCQSSDTILVMATPTYFLASTWDKDMMVSKRCKHIPLLVLKINAVAFTFRFSESFRFRQMNHNLLFHLRTILSILR